ncbi:ABC transporter ATP-binding protein [Vaginisenegalia massiliensis]|uniref:ABC transporter ATP-binding protein n=1 Tax=Vaginisenegalia massiliensis TaxID=2058294 RepID=UPI000F53030F|nr:ABC transporter ATP-binding protein [Vaginisenegalia massiliensis]
MTYLKVTNISKAYGTQQVLQDVSFEIQKGERFGLIGPNGAGKSTLIDIITGLIKADQGQVVIDGQNIKGHLAQIRGKIGLVPQDIGLIENLTVYDNLYYFACLYGLSGQSLKDKIDQILQAMGLEDATKKKVKELSGGMKRRLNIGAALLHDPEFLILDEPTVGVDPQSRQRIFEFLKQLNESGTTILYISHYMEEVEALCHRIFLLDQGRQVAYGTQDQVKALVRQSNRIRFEIDRVPANLTAVLMAQDNGIKEVQSEWNQVSLLVDVTIFSMMKLIKCLEAQDCVIKSIYVEDISLEETFLQLTGKRLRDE